ncbi:Acetylxylan esterase precursor [Rubripirellula lacrimiformis]|uniref:Acetylxylan esterase n=1 Tax=Rubripirellula lacrimiformis TaxID=1930273 RepID=A0A517NEY7_9BACT|nr:alpha/beta hydrolase [Rubripirellula lacrimiformis]QDT05689.1 Acetylxylan esterase precursor [Rubripirellula lacrimiformis]
MRLVRCTKIRFGLIAWSVAIYSLGLLGNDRPLWADSPKAASAASQAPTEHTLNYKTVSTSGKDVTLKIDWTRPADWKASDRRPAVVFFHGGGWVGGAPGQFAAHSEELAKLGMVCFRAQYRLLPKKNPIKPDRCIEDASDAIRYIRSHAAEFGIDPDRVAAGGGSAGGHLAAFLGMMDDVAVDGVSRKPNALLLFNPVYDNGPGGWGTGRVGDAYADYSPAHNITSDDPPAIVFLGTADSLIPVATGKKFQAESRAAGLKSDLHLYEGQPHGFFNATRDGGKHYRDTMAKTIDFLKSNGWIQ